MVILDGHLREYYAEWIRFNVVVWHKYYYLDVIPCAPC